MKARLALTLAALALAAAPPAKAAGGACTAATLINTLSPLLGTDAALFKSLGAGYQSTDVSSIQPTMGIAMADVSCSSCLSGYTARESAKSVAKEVQQKLPLLQFLTGVETASRATNDKRVSEVLKNSPAGVVTVVLTQKALKALTDAYCIPIANGARGHGLLSPKGVQAIIDDGTSALTPEQTKCLDPTQLPSSLDQITNGRPAYVSSPPGLDTREISPAPTKLLVPLGPDGHTPEESTDGDLRVEGAV